MVRLCEPVGRSAVRVWTAMSHLRVLPPPSPDSGDEPAGSGAAKPEEPGPEQVGPLTEEMRKSASDYLRSMIRVVPDARQKD